MTRVSLYITLEPKQGKPVSLARVNHPELLIDAARHAISEAEQLALSSASEDELLGRLHHQEAQRLRMALEMVLPELRMTSSLELGPSFHLN